MGLDRKKLRKSPLPASVRGVLLAVVLLGTSGVLAGCGGEATSGDERPQQGEAGEAGETGEAAGGGGTVDEPQTRPSPGNGQGFGSSDQDEQRDLAAAASVGEEVSVGEVGYTVTDAGRVTRLEDPYGGEPLTGNFLRVSLTFTNDSSEPVTVSDLGMYLYDGEGNQYETDTEAAYYLPEETAMYMLDRVNPGLSRDVQTIYEIPPGAGGFELEVSSGLFASETARIDLESEESEDSSAEESSQLTGSPAEIEEDARQAVEDYYEAVNADDFSYTYAHRDSRTQSAFTEEEWAKRNQWFEDTNSTTSVPVSVDLDESTLSSEQPVVNVERQLTIDATGYSEIRDATFVYEDGEWVVQYPEGGMPLYMPDATFEEFVRANSG